MSVILIAAVGANGVIGRDNDLPWRIRADLQHFKELTLGHTLVMGRKTYDSIGRPLPGRRTVVVTRQPEWSADGVDVVHSLEAALEYDGDLYVAGGGDIYRQALPYADRLELTEVDQSPAGDVTFPPFDPTDWTETARDPHPGFTFVSYARR
ncbi:dihydrofolate reductase [Kribbella sandramycini]|uniref:Dihydrofolate reductase n=1 Tax=Kribbella sandramycini TaxID=60450 RepID=A0A7Y4P1K3_9ACTN|nr:dihydrofolate reductase [Kribbella sandramycini]MBB6564496.1 dihydrofolate reductase [Kribbella sandramycini]NOL42200.1 dihydrofolate reductase [Kribbella sandramycini]